MTNAVAVPTAISEIQLVLILISSSSSFPKPNTFLQFANPPWAFLTVNQHQKRDCGCHGLAPPLPVPSWLGSLLLWSITSMPASAEMPHARHNYPRFSFASESQPVSFTAVPQGPAHSTCTFLGHQCHGCGLMGDTDHGYVPPCGGHHYGLGQSR